MNLYRLRPRRRKPCRLAACQLDLFASADCTPELPTPRAAQVLARRHRLSPHLARTVAELAGFHLEPFE